ncbi:Na/Pi cotransporter family protein [Patescibacteria group bacterium AH-259-L07]|nr:Na/Pi cotransporter family protein [Patescibacteria group bacterium AH-259-L07]
MLENILIFFTGLVFLLFGMLKLSREMQRIFSVRIRQFIKKLVKRPIQGVLVGGVVTAIFQSSSATTVLTVGLVSAGLISFFNSLGIILGAGIGTTITAQLVALKITEIAPLFIIIGVLLWLVGKDKKKSVGEVIFYFGLLFFGLSLMSTGMSPLRDNQTFIALLQQTKNPVFGILAGTIFTAIIQSSSVTTSILVLLGQQGLLTIEGAIPLFMGANIGTTITAIIASIGSGINARRTAFSHFLFKVISVIIFAPFILYFSTLLKTMNVNIGTEIAIGHLLFNIFLVVIFFFWLKPFSRFIKKILPGEEKTLPLWAEYLDERILKTPAHALEGVKKELHRGALLVREMYFKTITLLYEFHYSTTREVAYIEMVVDGLQRDVMRFLDKLPKEKMTRTQAIRLIQYSAMVDSIERIADKIVAISKLAQHKHRAKVKFTNTGLKEVKQVSMLIVQNINDVIKLISSEDERIADKIIKREDQVDVLVRKFQENHVERFYRREVSAADGPLFSDVLINLERISDQCDNIAEHYK